MDNFEKHLEAHVLLLELYPKLKRAIIDSVIPASIQSLYSNMTSKKCACCGLIFPATSMAVPCPNCAKPMQSYMLPPGTITPTSPTLNATCTICKHQWYTLDPFGCCPKCGSIPYTAPSTALQPMPPPPLTAPVTNVQSGIALQLKSKTAIVDSLLQQGLISPTDYATILGFPPAVPSPMTQSGTKQVNVDDVPKWLVANGFLWEPAHNMLSMYANCKQCWITDLDIYQDPIQVINTAEAWFKDNNILFQPWDGWDEETRKIDLGDLYKKQECQHEKGATPLMNSKNELWIICRKCGKDLELVKK